MPKRTETTVIGDAEIVYLAGWTIMVAGATIAWGIGGSLAALGFGMMLGCMWKRS